MNGIEKLRGNKKKPDGRKELQYYGTHKDMVLRPTMYSTGRPRGADIQKDQPEAFNSHPN